MKLGSFIKALSTFEASRPINFDFPDVEPTSFQSYRGYYYELALGYEIAESYATRERSTVGSILLKARECVGKSFTGYKGGEFVMTEETPMWASNWGDCTNRKIVGVRANVFGHVIITTEDEDDTALTDDMLYLEIYRSIQSTHADRAEEIMRKIEKRLLR